MKRFAYDSAVDPVDHVFKLQGTGEYDLAARTLHAHRRPEREWEKYSASGHSVPAGRSYEPSFVRQTSVGDAFGLSRAEGGLGWGHQHWASLAYFWLRQP